MEGMDTKGMDMKGIIVLLLGIAAYTDIKKQRIPDVIPLFLAGLGGIELCLHLGAGSGERIAGAFACFGIFALILFICPGAFGGGDVKLMTAGGWLMGIRCALAAFVCGILSGGIYCLVISATGKQKEKIIPFGPFLCIGLGIGLYRGEELWNWYFH